MSFEYVSYQREDDVMNPNRNAYRKLACRGFALFATLLWISSPAGAAPPPPGIGDTSIYQEQARQNCFILLDNSESMDFGVYQNTIDYGAMFDYLFTLNEANPPSTHTYIYDTINNSNVFYQNHEPMNKIFLWKGKIGVTQATVLGKTTDFTGDAADPGYLWYNGTLVDTHTLIDEYGNLTNDGSGSPSRITVYTSSNPLDPKNGHILFDGSLLPLTQDILQHNYTNFYDGTVVDNGFSGLLNAPGYYFSGYSGISANGPASADQIASINSSSTTEDIYFFLTGNWVNMQEMYNLHYMPGASPLPQGAASGDDAWVYQPYPLPSTAQWPVTNKTYAYPSGGGNYPANATNTQVISIPGAQQMQLYFSAFNVLNTDSLKIYDSNNLLVVTYDNANTPISASNSNGSGWSPVITGGTATLYFTSSKTSASPKSTTATGYTISEIRSTTLTNAYLMQSRYSVATDALSYIVNTFADKINWGFASFNSTKSNCTTTGTGCDGGAPFASAINPNIPGMTMYTPKDGGAIVGVTINPKSDSSVNASNIVTQMGSVVPPPDTFSVQLANNNTPLMEALQDVWINGFYKQQTTLASNAAAACTKNYAIVMSDGYPAHDFDTIRIQKALASVPAFSDTENEKLTQDPYQYPTPPPDYFSDVAYWMYTHSWVDGSLVTSPTNSYVNIMTNNIAFGSYQPLMQAAAGDGGGQYLSVYNKEQLVAAFNSLGLMISQAVSFTSPVVSVDTANKIQSGNDLYMGLFLPQANSTWTGNLKKWELGDGSTTMSNVDMIYDANDNAALNSDGTFKLNTAPWWGIDFITEVTTPNIENGGAGQVMLTAVKSNFATQNSNPSSPNQNYWSRPIYTWKGGAMVLFNRNNITPTDLGLAAGDIFDRDSLINFIHGYSYDNNGTTGSPVTYRSWPMGAVVHSQPVIVDYFNTASSTLPLEYRYVVVGSNDGMLHVFTDPNAVNPTPAWGGGQEVFSFIPPDMLPLLQYVQANNMYDTVDGSITLYRYPADTSNVDYPVNNPAYAKNPRYLIFGERRGGGTYWCLDVTNTNPTKWTVVWNYTNPEITQTWSAPQVASIPISIAANGAKTYQDVVIFAGGYDATTEDNFPETFVDSQSNPTGNPYLAYPYINANIDPTKWNPKGNPSIGTDYVGDGKYHKYNPGTDISGRGIFAVDIDNPATVVTITPASSSPQQVLPFQATYSATGTSLNPSTGSIQTRSDMPFCFPATPSLVTNTDQNVVNGNLQYEENVLQAFYATDIYTNIFKALYTFNTVNTGTSSSPSYKLVNYQLTPEGTQVSSSAGWSVNKVFSANPGSASASGTMLVGTDPNDDSGRKAFSPPAVSWGGTAGNFQASNYTASPTLTFNNLGTLASLFIGTGDTEHPLDTMIRNRLYAVYDDSSVTATQTQTPPTTTVPATGAPYVENNLLNLTCDELDVGTTITGPPLNGALFTPFTTSSNMQSQLQAALTPFYDVNFATEETGTSYAKGWYITLADQESLAVCPPSHVTYTGLTLTATSDNNAGVQVLSAVTLFYNTLYYTAYQASINQPCNPQGNGFAYSINYLNGSAVYNINSTTVIDVADRAQEFTGISGIPSAFTIIVRNGQAAAMASMGGSIIGPGGFANDQYEINTPGLGLQLFYWRDSNSMAPLLNP